MQSPGVLSPAMAGRPKKVILWTVPRGVSTAFLRAMMNRDRVLVALDPLSKAYILGRKRTKQSEVTWTELVEDSNFFDIKHQSETLGQNGDYDLIFIKDLSFFLKSRLETTEFLPRNFCHTFLIRDPRKSILSLYKIASDDFDFGHEMAGFQEQHQLITLVMEKLGQNAIVIDADDLIQHPECILRKYCEAVGISMDIGMLHWGHESPENIKQITEHKGRDTYFKHVFESRTFEKEEPAEGDAATTLRNLPQIVRDVVEANIPIYEKMYKLRIIP